MKLIKYAIILTVTCSFSSLAVAQGINRTAIIADLKGEAQAKLINEKNWRSAKIGMTLHEGDTIRTSAGSWVLLNLDRGKTAAIEIKENTQLLLSQLKKDDNVDTKSTLLTLRLVKF